MEDTKLDGENPNKHLETNHGRHKQSFGSTDGLSIPMFLCVFLGTLLGALAACQIPMFLRAFLGTLAFGFTGSYQGNKGKMVP